MFRIGGSVLGSAEAVASEQHGIGTSQPKQPFKLQPDLL